MLVPPSALDLEDVPARVLPPGTFFLLVPFCPPDLRLDDLCGLACFTSSAKGSGRSVRSMVRARYGVGSDSGAAPISSSANSRPPSRVRSALRNRSKVSTGIPELLLSRGISSLGSEVASESFSDGSTVAVAAGFCDVGFCVGALSCRLRPRPRPRPRREARVSPGTALDPLESTSRPSLSKISTDHETTSSVSTGSSSLGSLARSAER